jgi:hypothetical protein
MKNKFNSDTKVIEVVNGGKAIGTIRKTKNEFFAYFNNEETVFSSEKGARNFILNQDAKHSISKKFNTDFYANSCISVGLYDH